MPQSRKNQISLIDTPHYHWLPAVFVAFLWWDNRVVDKVTGQSDAHRQG